MKRLRNILNERKISAYKFAKDLGFPQSTVWEWLDGKYVPKAEKMATIAEYLDVPIQVLIEDAIESKKETK